MLHMIQHITLKIQKEADLTWVKGKNKSKITDLRFYMSKELFFFKKEGQYFKVLKDLFLFVI